MIRSLKLQVFDPKKFETEITKIINVATKRVVVACP